MASNEKQSDVVLNFKTNGEVSYAKTIKDINKEMNLAAVEYKKQASAMDDNATATEKLRATKEKLEKQLSLAEKRSQMLREEYEKSVKETGQYSAESEKLYKQLLNSETGENKLRSALEKTNDALKEQGDVSLDTAKKIQKIEEAGEKVKGAGEKMTVGVTAPILAVGAASLAAFNEVDGALDTIITKTGATGEQADRLAESFEKVGGNTHLELQTVGEAIGEVNTQYGFMDEQLEKTTDYMLKFAEINDADVSQSAINSRKVIEAYELSYDDLNMVLDVTTKTAQDTGQSVDKLFDVAVKGAPQIKQMGLSFGEGVTLLGQLEQAGVDGQTSLSYLSKASITYAKDGKTLQDGLEGTIEKIKSSKDETEQLTIASEVFGTKGASRMLDAINRGTLDFDALADAAKNSSGAVGTTFDATLDPIDKANEAMNNAKLTLAGVGESVQVALLPVMESAIDGLQRFKAWFDQLDEGTKANIVTIASIVAAIGPLLVILGTVMGSMTKIVSGVKAVQSVFTGLQAVLAANPFILVIAGIAALVAGLVWAYNNVKWFRDGVNAFFSGVKDVGVQAFNFLGEFISGIFSGISKTFNDYVGGWKKIFSGFIDFFTGIFTGNWRKAWQGIVQIFDGIFSTITAVAKAPLNGMITIVNGFIRGLNKIKVPKWVPGVGGKGIDIGEIPYLAKGGHLINGTAIVGEAGPELLQVGNGKTTVTPLSESDKKYGGPRGDVKIEQHNHFGKVDYNNPSERFKMDRDLQESARQAIIDAGGIPT